MNRERSPKVYRYWKLMTWIALLALIAGLHGRLDRVWAGELIRGENDALLIDRDNMELRFTATVKRNVTKPSVVEWGRRGQAWIGSKGGTMEGYFIFVTDVQRKLIDKALRDFGLKASNQLTTDQDWDKHKGLKPSTTLSDFLNGPPVLVRITYKKGDRMVQRSLEELIKEKVEIEGKDVIRPYTPHFIYHGTGEALDYPSGCIVCPSDCFGGIITDNRLPILTYDSWYKIDWDLMPPPGTKVEVSLIPILDSQAGSLLEQLAN